MSLLGRFFRIWAAELGVIVAIILVGTTVWGCFVGGIFLLALLEETPMAVMAYVDERTQERLCIHGIYPLLPGSGRASAESSSARMQPPPVLAPAPHGS